MTCSRLRTLAALALAAAASLTLPAPAAAHGCGFSCDPGMACNGSCTINAPGPSGTGATCGGFQSPRLPTCKMDRPELFKGGGAVACGNSHGKVGWAVVRSHWPSPEEPTGAHVLRASSEELADYARHVFKPDPDVLPNARLESELLVAAPAGPCVEVQYSVPSLQPDLKGVGHWQPLVAYFRATTAKERFTSFEVLYSEAPAADVQRALAAAREWLWVYTKGENPMPLEVYGSVIVVDGYLGFMLEAASPLAPPDPGAAQAPDATSIGIPRDSMRLQGKPEAARKTW